MTWNEVLMNIINTVLRLLVISVIPYLFSLAKAQVKNNKIEKYLGRFEEIVKDAVAQVQQTYVDNMKAENLFDKKAQEEAFDMVRATVLNTVNESMMAVVTEAVGDFEEYLRNKIEAEVYNLKIYTSHVGNNKADEGVSEPKAEQ